MQRDESLVNDPRFRSLLKRRARWRWGLSGLLIGAYLLWGVAGIYFPSAYSASFMGATIPWGMAVGVMIIVLSIVLSIVYVKVVGRIEAEEIAEEEHGR